MQNCWKFRIKKKNILFYWSLQMNNLCLIIYAFKINSKKCLPHKVFIKNRNNIFGSDTHGSGVRHATMWGRINREEGRRGRGGCFWLFSPKINYCPFGYCRMLKNMKLIFSCSAFNFPFFLCSNISAILTVLKLFISLWRSNLFLN